MAKEITRPLDRSCLKEAINEIVASIHTTAANAWKREAEIIDLNHPCEHETTDSLLALSRMEEIATYGFRLGSLPLWGKSKLGIWEKIENSGTLDLEVRLFERDTAIVCLRGAAGLGATDYFWSKVEMNSQGREWLRRAFLGDPSDHESVDLASYGDPKSAPDDNLLLAYRSRVKEYEAKGRNPPVQTTKAGDQGDREWAVERGVSREKITKWRKDSLGTLRRGRPKNSTGNSTGNSAGNSAGN
jgi:hypothetical protein